MRTAHRILKNVFSLTLANVAKNGIAIIYTIYLARVLTPDGYGVFGFAQSYIIYFIILVNLGLDVLGIRQISKYPESIEKYVNSILSLKNTIAIFSFATLAGMAFLIPELQEIKFILLIAGLQIFVNSFQLQWFFEGTERMEIIAIRQLLISILNLVGIFLLVKGPDDTIIAVSIISASMLLNTLWTLIYYVIKYNKIKWDFDPKFWWYLIKTSVPIGMMFFIVIIYNSVDTVMLKFMQSYHDTGIYIAAHKVLIVLTVPGTIFQGAFFPNFSRHSDYQNPSNAFEKYALLMILSGSFFAMAMIVFAHDAMSILGNQYSETAPLVQIMMFNIVFQYISLTFYSPLIAWHKEKQVLLATGIGCVINLLLNFLLIPHYSYYGAAIATVSSELVVMVFHWYFFYKLTRKLYISYALKGIIISLVSCVPSYFMVANDMNIILSIATCIILFISLNFIFKTVTLTEIKHLLKKEAI